MGCPTISTVNQSLTFTVEAVLGDGTPVDATGDVSYSVVNAAEEVLLSGVMDKVAGEIGEYTKTIITSETNGFELNTSYTINISAIISGIQTTKSYVFIVVSAGFSESNDYYCVRSDIEDVFGESNVQKWTDLDNDGDSTKITARINRAIIWATAEINSKLRNSVYTIPLADDDGDVPVEIIDIASNLAGVWLYENRGVQDFNPETGYKYHRLEYNRKRAYKSISDIAIGIKNIDAVKTVTDSPIPKSVKSRRWPHSRDI